MRKINGFRGFKCGNCGICGIGRTGEEELTTDGLGWMRMGEAANNDELKNVEFAGIQGFLCGNSGNRCGICGIRGTLNWAEGAHGIASEVDGIWARGSEASLGGRATRISRLVYIILLSFTFLRGS